MAVNRCWQSFRCFLYIFAILAWTASTNLIADDFYLLSGNRTSFDARIELIDLAQQEINIAYYAIDSGDVALTLLDHLRNAAKRGVRVNILVDGLQSRLPSGLEDLLIQDGVNLRAYHPVILTRPLWLNRRIHYKLFIVDRCAMIIGSRNLQDSHFGCDDNNFLDMDALLTGSICDQATDHFYSLWNSSEVFPVDESRSFGSNLRDDMKLKVPRLVAKELLQSSLDGKELNADSGMAKTSLFDSIMEKRAAVYEHSLKVAAERLEQNGKFRDDQCQRSDQVFVENLSCSRLVHDCGLHKSDKKFQRQVIELIDSAERYIWIESPYPVLERVVMESIERAVSRGIEVVLLTNSLGSTDRTAPYAAYQNDKREYQRIGVKLVEYTGDDTLHSKSILIDDRSVLISSYNMDVRSDRLNLEFGVLINDSRVCDLIKDELAARMSTGEKVGRNGLGIPEVIRSDANLAKLSKMRLRQWLVPLIRSSL